MSENFYLIRRLFQVGDTRKLIEPGERTPYPIIIERPTFRDIFFNMGLPEWTPFLVSIPLGTALGLRFTHNLNDLPLSRRRAFGGTIITLMIFGFYLGVKGSFYKLIGFEDNGLRWRFPDQRVKKYDFTSDVKGFWEDLLRGNRINRN
ncbi:hypothetical protein SteCoe_5881 [Stentor coeruleus]|uniref:NADH-ubiquinone oxidoreductase 21kDa subunit N-terminal domain-containing protein n=1 Tax=Stentor coeruleus TaxID=5963 RepID=A0A1R2CR92_9CILI|nr:hypothetical protein SteCoe_5881 [Stentor coeruleus]